jgi:membrane protease YdiL (CAAX protease family)
VAATDLTVTVKEVVAVSLEARSDSPVTAHPERRDVGRILAGCALMFVVLQGGALLLLPRLDLTWTSLIVAAVMLATAFAIERAVFKRDLAQAAKALGFGRPESGAVVVAVIITAGMLAFFPLYSVATGTPFGLKADWLWVLAGVIAVNGIAEETLFRGFVFGHLRQAGHSFRRAGLISMLIFAAVHLFLFTNSPAVVAAFATALAVAAAFPFAFLYERAGMSIWAGVILHVAAHAPRLLDIPQAQVLTVTSAWIAVEFGAMFLVFVFRNSLLKVVRPQMLAASPVG